MIKKSGITMTILAISIAIMLLLITSSVIIGAGYIDDAKLDEFETMVHAVSDSVNAYILKNGTLPVTGQSIIYTNYSSDFAKAVTDNNDISNKLYIVDVSKLENYTIKEGKGTLSNSDVFVVAENTNNVYYLKGFKYKGKFKYGI